MSGMSYAKPRSVSVLLLDGGKGGTIRLHPNQSWKVTFFDDDKTKVGIERDNLYLIMNKELCESLFYYCI